MLENNDVSAIEANASLSKKAWTSPTLVRHGTITEITRGQFTGETDALGMGASSLTR